VLENSSPTVLSNVEGCVENFPTVIFYGGGGEMEFSDLKIFHVFGK
jgi:hypothetical protein